MRYRLDHLAFRTLNKEKALKFFVDALGYQIQEDFPIPFNDEGTDVAVCTSLEPSKRTDISQWIFQQYHGLGIEVYHRPAEIFVSEGTPKSIVHDWCLTHGGGGLHHIALQVPDESTVEAEMQKWLEKGWAPDGFSSEPINCEGLSQVFTKPSSILGVVFELIKRDKYGFCKDSVKALMQASKGD